MSMRLASHAAFNLLGAALPALFTIATLPVIVNGLGATHFGLLALVTAIVGYFALVDINISAGSTKYVAEFAARGDSASTAATVTFGLAAYACIGFIGMGLVLALADTFVSRVFRIPAEHHGIAVEAMHVAAFGFLAGQIQAYLHSVPGALMRFDVSGRWEAAFGCIVPMLSVALVLSGMGLVELVWLRVCASTVHALVLLFALRRLMPGLTLRWPGASVRRSLLRFSGWSFMSKVAAVSNSQADKLIIGSLVGVTNLTYYVVPTTLSSRVFGLVQRLSGVMLPHSSSMSALERIDELRLQYLAASRYLFFLTGGIAVTLAFLAGPVLTIWLGPEYAAHGSVIMAIIVVSAWVDSMTNLPTMVNDGLGHPHVSGCFALLRTAAAIAFLTVGALHWGLEGVAVAHLVTSGLGTFVFLLYVHSRTVPVSLLRLCWEAFLPGSIALAALSLVAATLAPFAERGWGELLAAFGTCGLVFALLGVTVVMHREHREVAGRSLLGLGARLLRR